MGLEYDELRDEWKMDPVSADIFSHIIRPGGGPVEPVAPGQPTGDLLQWETRKELYRRLFRAILGEPAKVEEFLYNLGRKPKAWLEKMPTPRLKISPEGLFIDTELGVKRTMDAADKIAQKLQNLPQTLGLVSPPTPPPPPPVLEVPAQQRIQQWGEPTMPTEGEEKPTAPTGQVGKPQYSAPVPPPTEPIPAPAPTPAPVPQPAPPTVTAPPTAAPQPQPPAGPELGKLIKPWKSSVDFEKELMNIFNESIKEYGALPKSKFKEPTTVREFISDFAKYAAVAFSGKDPWEYKIGEYKRAEAEADKERNYAIQRASQLANMRISALTERARREDMERQKGSDYLVTIGNMYPQIRQQPAYQAALASYAGVPIEEAKALLEQHVDPKTGLLKGFYKDPTELEIEKLEKIQEFKKRQLKEIGFSDEQAAYTAATGTYDPEKFAMMQLQKAYNDLGVAMKTQDPAKIEAARNNATTRLEQYKEIQKLSHFDMNQQRALDFMDRFSKNPVGVRQSLKAVMQDDHAVNAVIQYNTALAIGASGVKIPEPKEAKPKDDFAAMAMRLVQEGNPEKIKAFTDKWEMSPHQVVQLYMGWIKESGLPGTLVEPLHTFTKLFKTADPKKFIDLMTMPEMTQMIVNNIRMTYWTTLADIEKKIANTKQPLTNAEIYQLATFWNEGDHARAKEYLLTQVYGSRGLKTKTK